MRAPARAEREAERARGFSSGRSSSHTVAFAEAFKVSFRVHCPDVEATGEEATEAALATIKSDVTARLLELASSLGIELVPVVVLGEAKAMPGGTGMLLVVSIQHLPGEDVGVAVA